jgi:exodeoxyribonuclease VII large subunit
VLFPPTVGEEVWGIRDLYRRVSVAISKGLRGRVTVRAEVRTLNDRGDRCFITLAEPARDGYESDAVLNVVVWRTAWARIRAQLDEQGLALAEGMTVTLRGEVRLGPPGTGRVQLDCSGLDTAALLGELAARRRALRRALAAEDLLEANRRRPLAALPLRVGLAASPHSQGYRDFRGVLAASPYTFTVTEHPVVVQGVGAPAAIASAVNALGRAGVDVIVLVRGGGAREDLDAFDSELVARAVAAAPVPVWTGLGHTGDRCLADEVCAASHATPTACAQALVSRVAEVDRDLAGRARRLRELARSAGLADEERLAAGTRLLARSACASLDRAADATAARSAALRRAAGRALNAAGASVTRSAVRLPALAGTTLDRQAEELRGRAAQTRRRVAADLRRSDDAVAASRRVLAAFDPVRQLERGWTMTVDGDGALVRTAASLRAGQRITTRFVDGARTSVVDG